MSDFERYRISNAELQARDVPDPHAPWEAVAEFALSFDGYAHHKSFSRCASIANRWAAAFAKTGEMPDTLNDLRTCLFFEQRRWRHFEDSPDAGTMQYVAALLVKIRNVVSSPHGTAKPRRRGG